MSGCTTYDDNFKDLFPPGEKPCQKDCIYPRSDDPEDTAIYSTSKYSDVRKKHEAAFDAKFKDIKKEQSGDQKQNERHAQLACLMHHMLTNIKSTTIRYIDDEKTAEDKKKLLETQKNKLKEYETILKNSENSGLVTD